MVKFDHMALPVTDVVASRDWYVKNLGFEVEFEALPHRIAIRDSADFTIFLEQTNESLAGRRCALTIQVDNVDSKYAELHGRGVQFEKAPTKNFWGYGAELRDPSGYLVMLWDEKTMKEKSG
jgi:catechol 2,3-dioxygenase-like lactoylglutathione lyase family enzyme